MNGIGRAEIGVPALTVVGYQKIGVGAFVPFRANLDKLTVADNFREKPVIPGVTVKPGIGLFIDGQPLLKERSLTRPLGLSLANSAGSVRDQKEGGKNLILGGGNLTSGSKNFRHFHFPFVCAPIGTIIIIASRRPVKGFS